LSGQDSVSTYSPPRAALIDSLQVVANNANSLHYMQQWCVIAPFPVKARTTENSNDGPSMSPEQQRWPTDAVTPGFPQPIGPDIVALWATVSPG
jgi:hypothetical protein